MRKKPSLQNIESRSDDSLSCLIMNISYCVVPTIPALVMLHRLFERKFQLFYNYFFSSSRKATRANKLLYVECQRPRHRRETGSASEVLSRHIIDVTVNMKNFKKVQTGFGWKRRISSWRISKLLRDKLKLLCNQVIWRRVKSNS